MLPRHPNLIWEQLASDHLAGIIVDGHHLPPPVVSVMSRCKALDRLILITDAMAAAGCPPGWLWMGTVDVIVGPDKRVSLSGTPFLAGLGPDHAGGGGEDGAVHGRPAGRSAADGINRPGGVS